MKKFPSHALLAGSIGGILFVVGVVSLIGPVADDSPSKMAADLADGRMFALVALFGIGLAAMFGIWFLAVLSSWLRSTVPNGGEELGTAALAAATLSIGLACIGMALFYGATYELAGQGGSKALLGLVDAANAAMMLTKFSGALVVAVLSIALPRTGYFPRWFAKLGFFAVAALVVSSIGLFTTDDFTQFGGPLDFYGTLPAGLWSLLLLALLFRGQSSPAQA